MMYQKETFPSNYIEENKLHVLELPYVEDELSMLVLLPEESQDGSDALQKVSLKSKKWLEDKTFDVTWWTLIDLELGQGLLYLLYFIINLTDVYWFFYHSCSDASYIRLDS